MTLAEVMKQLEKMGSASIRKVFARHGCPETGFGVRIGDMKRIVRKVKVDSALARELYRTGNPDAQYLAGLIADGSEFSRAELKEWVKKASWQMVSEYTVAWVAAEHPGGWKLGLEWIESKDDSISSAGWATLGAILSVRPDAELDLEGIEKLLARVVKDIRKAPDRTRYTMNGFVIGVGCFVAPLTGKAIAAAKAIGTVEVDMGGTACKVPAAADYIAKRKAMGRLGVKRKQLKC